MADDVFDLAFSFAGEHRVYVESTKNECEKLGLRVFYDRDMSNEWWGQNFIREQRATYGAKTRFFVPFISTEYLQKAITRDEFSAAMMTAVKQGDGYILPVLVGDVKVPEDLLHPHIGYLRSEDYSPPALAEEMRKKVQGRPNQPVDVTSVVDTALNLRMPKSVPTTFSKYAEQEAVLDFLANQFRAIAPQLQTGGFVTTVREPEDAVIVRIERQGNTVYSLDARRGGRSFGSDSAITFSVDQHRFGGTGGINGWVEPTYDVDADEPRLRVSNLSFLHGRVEVGSFLTKEELFQAMWEKVLERLEH